MGSTKRRARLRATGGNSTLCNPSGRGSAWAGAINAALFLEYCVPESQDWLHIDLFAWNDGARAGRPVGGKAQTIRTLLA